MDEKLDAVILRRTRYSESSLIVVAFSREQGRVDLLARGCRRPKSPMHGRLELFNREELLLRPRARTSLDLLLATDIIAEPPVLRREPAAFAAASLLGEVVLSGCMVRDPHPAAYEALLFSLKGLVREGQAGAAMVAGLLALLRELGFAPDLGACAVCGGEAVSERVALSTRRGGLVCSARCAGEEAGPRFDGREARILRFLARTGAEGAARLAWTLAEARPLIDALGRYAEDCLGRRLRSLSVLPDLLRLSPQKGAA